MPSSTRTASPRTRRLRTHDLDVDGYDSDGMRPDIFGVPRDREGYDSRGYNENGYNENGYNEDGYNEDGYNEDGYNEDGYNEDGYDRAGDHRLDDYRDPYYDSWERSSSTFPWCGSNPPYRMLAMPGEVTRNRPYFGLEIEQTANCTTEQGNLIRANRDVWVKRDCSVRGYEMVTHPMTYAYFTHRFAKSVVDDLRRAGATVISATNGLHVHVSRSGFNSEAHQLRWIEFLYHIRVEVMRIGGRDGGQWGRFRIDDLRTIRAYFEARRAVRLAARPGGTPATYEQRNLAWYPNTPRYIAVNVQPQETFEVRNMASPTSSAELSLRVELMAASVEYTRRIVPAPRNWESLLAWMRADVDRAARYPALAMHMGVVAPVAAQADEQVLVLR